jgi:2-dehydropantoate 2-reductase
MRILILGAGAIGGYFGGRLLAAGRDVTFLVRPARAAALARTGLVIKSPTGDVDLPTVPTLTAPASGDRFDLALLSCKAYDVDGALATLAPFVGPDTAILPLLNGMRHLDTLDARFGADRVLGGQCVISATLDGDGHVLHLNDQHALTFGERSRDRSPRIEQIAQAFADAGFQPRLSGNILQEMWDKWIFIATIAGITCLMRAAIGDIVAAGAADLAARLFDEAAAVAEAAGYPLSETVRQRGIATVTAPGSPIMASMLRDIERGGAIEADQIIGDLLARSPDPAAAGLLRIVDAHVKAYQARHARG